MAPLSPPPQGVVAGGSPHQGPESHDVLPAAAAAASDSPFDSFTYAIAHDLVAPLRAVRGYAGALVEDYVDQLPPGAQELVGRMRHAVETAQQRVEALLRLTGADRTALRLARCDVTRLVSEVVEDLRRAEPQRDAAIAIAPNMYATADRSLLGIVIENLVANAWKFTRGRSRTQIDVGMEDRPDETELWVRDNGIGFDMRQAHRLGVPFQRLHAGTPHEGTGIGLASCRRIVERHGGRLWAESAPGQGATFHVLLPRVTPC